jgi:hypothetical protein
MRHYTWRYTISMSSGVVANIMWSGKVVAVHWLRMHGTLRGSRWRKKRINETTEVHAFLRHFRLDFPSGPGCTGSAVSAPPNETNLLSRGVTYSSLPRFDNSGRYILYDDRFPVGRRRAVFDFMCRLLFDSFA